jgi:hypothetical protein
MNFTSFDAVFFTAGFLVPGFIWSAVLSMLVPRASVKPEGRVFEFLTLSCINHGLWSWALFPIFRTGFIDQQPYWSGLFLFVIIFLSPIALGLISAHLQQRERVATLLRRFGFRTVHAIPTAWDWQFSREKPYWVVLTLKNGSVIYGLYGPGSFAGSDPERRDLYLVATYRLLQTGDWAPIEDSGGILITADQIATIEFRKLAEETYE